MLYTPLFTSLIVTLHLAQQTSLQLGQLALSSMHLYLHSLIRNLVFNTRNKFTVRPICNAPIEMYLQV